MTIFLVRHATAGRRGFHDDDMHRPLDVYGHAQAGQLVSTLHDRGIQEIHSSAATRCRETMQPLSEAIGVPVTNAAQLLEGSALSRVLAFVRSFGNRNVVLCSHGDIIPEVVRALEVGGTRIQGDRRCAKGSVWELAVTPDGMIPTASYNEVLPLSAAG